LGIKKVKVKFEQMFLTKGSSSSRRRRWPTSKMTTPTLALANTRRAGDLEEDEAEYEDIDDMEGDSEEE